MWTEFAAEDLADGVAVVNAEADVGGDGEATVVLVEGEVVECGDLGRVPVWARTWVLGGERGRVVGFGLGGCMERLWVCHLGRGE